MKYVIAVFILETLSLYRESYYISVWRKWWIKFVLIHFEILYGQCFHRLNSDNIYQEKTIEMSSLRPEYKQTFPKHNKALCFQRRFFLAMSMWSLNILCVLEHLLMVIYCNISCLMRVKSNRVHINNMVLNINSPRKRENRI
jgi:hypothetical protein